ncbi:MAG TPA: hypothetical protein VG941_01055 [Candidatus Paceibacterota bacterium]|nr:hypothetical protein [Candidatus Paceibacterota bacterium]
MKSLQAPIFVAALFIVVVVFIVGAFNLYGYIPHLDKIFHFFGGGIAAWFCIEWLRARKPSFHVQKSWLATAGLVLAIGLVWELAEHLSSVYSPVYAPWFLKYFYGGDTLDTIGDVIADLAGALVIIFSYPRSKNRG